MDYSNTEQEMQTFISLSKGFSQFQSKITLQTLGFILWDTL